MTEMLTDRYRELLAGVISCYDRIVMKGTLLGACYAAGMTGLDVGVTDVGVRSCFLPNAQTLKIKSQDRSPRRFAIPPLGTTIC